MFRAQNNSQGATGMSSTARNLDLEADAEPVDLADDAIQDVAVDVDVDAVPTQKPHFLDYDAVPPPEFAHALSLSGSAGEQLKLDKKYERDGEISDYELAASGYTKKEFTQDDNTLHFMCNGSSGTCGVGAVSKPKHFLDENPIPPDYMLAQELREHRSLDRNFERQSEQQQQQQELTQRNSSASPASTSGGGGGAGSVGGGRKRSLDRSTRSSRERFKDSSYTLARFLDGNIDPLPRGIPKGAAWTESFEERYGNLQLPPMCDSSSDVDDGSKVECVYSLLSMLGSKDPLEMSKKFHELSGNPKTCTTLRRCGCIPLLVQMMHSSDNDEHVRKFASLALQNVVHSHPDEKAGRREAKVLRLLEQIMDYCNFLKTLLQSGGEAIADDSDRHPLAAMSSLMKVSFDEEHRHAMCELGALQAIPNLVHLDHAVHGPKPEDQCCNSLRRYALMALTNLTFGDENNKAFLCSQKLFMEALVAQLDSAPDDLLQVTASVLRNLSWRADNNMKAVLNEIGTVTALAHAAMKNKSENTLKAILSALWNLSAHCSTNKAQFCAVDGALAFLVKMLTYEGPSKTLKIIENAGGILRNVSSHIAVCEPYRQILREHNCLAILLQQLKSESLTVVSNSCGTLWNLSARCPEDQKFLWDNGAVPMLRSLIHSKHAMISEGSSSALKNLLNFRPSVQNQNQLDPIARSMGLKKLPTLNARKQKALQQELGEKTHAETCDNLDVAHSTTTVSAVRERDSSSSSNLELLARRYPLVAGGGGPVSLLPPPPPLHTTSTRLTRSAMLTKSESRDSIFSAKSDTAYEHVMRSHSASDANRNTPKLTNNNKNYAGAAQVTRATAAFELVQDTEITEELPIDYSVKYNEQEPSGSDDASVANTVSNYATYQETDLDQPTDFSLRYAENQLESDADISPPEVAVETKVGAGSKITDDSAANAITPKLKPDAGNEILLILEDSVKCYQTEDTPYVISNAASITDLRQGSKSETNLTMGAKPSVGAAAEEMPPSVKKQPQQRSTQYGSGAYTPEKPINYCEEGTPGYFSRYDSLSSLEESPTSKEVTKTEADIPLSKTQPYEIKGDEPKSAGASQTATSVNSALETPLMFSRRSSMDSLVNEDVGPCDDKSSVVSDFSRLASGVISPSEIPDSPTQSMPQSPRRNSNAGGGGGGGSAGGSNQCPIATRSVSSAATRGGANEVKPPLRSVFEDDLSTFHVENTPAQFSSATSLSSLSIAEDEQPQAAGSSCKPLICTKEAQIVMPNHPISEGEEDESNLNNNDDDYLLASCINMGMNRTVERATISKAKLKEKARNIPQDEPRQYCTEDTPALLSKVGSNTDLSTISINSGNHEIKDVNAFALSQPQGDDSQTNRFSQNLSDDMSSNVSESDVAGISSADILQQCIRDGMTKSTAAATPVSNAKNHNNNKHVDPIEMLRRGGNTLPPYLPVTDEMNKYILEDSPCNFSVMSGLSNLTVGSSLVGPAVQLKGSESTQNENAIIHAAVDNTARQEDVRRDQLWQDDSLSSLSIDSEDDTNLLSQAIAAGCNRPKSNLGFSSTTSTSKRSNSLSSSQPISINAATSASSLNSAVTARNYQKQQKHQQLKNQTVANAAAGVVNNESYSSVDSSDSNDNQSKSLFELCILTGMYKSKEGSANNISSSSGGGSALRNKQQRGGDFQAPSTQSNPNLKQYDSLPLQLTQPTSYTPNRQRRHHHQTLPQQHQHQHHHTHQHHQRERERKDEKLLLECISTGISKKIGSNSVSTGTIAMMASNSGSSGSKQLRAVPKNVEATSAAALEPCHPMAATTLVNVSSTAAAPDVEKQAQHKDNNSKQQANTNTNSNNNNYCNPNCNNISLATHADTIDAARNHQHQHSTTAVAPQTATTSDQVKCDKSTPDHANDPEIKASAIGSNALHSPDDNDDNTSDESNQSFIMETMVSLDGSPQMSMATNAAVDKHKDPDLMLKSVERLTLEFVTSAEQLRTQNSSSSNTQESQKRSEAAKHTNSNNTWNDHTCPNDVSFPEISVSAPILASLSLDDEDVDIDEEQATEVDHKDLHDFAEITPTNEVQMQPPSLGMLEEMELNPGIGGTQPNSLETETDTLRNDQFSMGAYSSYNSYTQSTSSFGINFKLGGQVQSAASVPGRQQSLYFNGTSSSIMTNSTIIAYEARALAENLQQLNDAADNDELTERTFSITSLDLDNVRPPSGMESLNISGCYQDQSATQPNSLQRSPAAAGYMPHSPQFPTKSPKFPRKSLPVGLVARRALGQLTGSVESVNSSCNLLDNIKPPSLMDELLDSMISVASIQSEIADLDSSMATTISVSNYETAAGGLEFDDNTVTLQSCCENMPRDDEEEDEDATMNEFSSAESTPQKPASSSPAMNNVGGEDKRTLTPKQKRKISKDRFKTYTISDNTRDVLSEEQQQLMEADETLQIEMIESPQPNIHQKLGRRGSAERYKTQIIECPRQLFESPPSRKDDCTSEGLPASIRAMTQKFTFITCVEGDDCNSLECDQNSETESCHGQDDEQGTQPNCKHYANGNEPTAEEVQEISGRARISNPLATDTEATKETVQENQPEVIAKAVRGRKKAAYISPYGMQHQRINSNVATGINTRTNIKAKATTSAPAKRNANTTTATVSTNTKLTIAQKKKPNDAQKQQSAADRPLERQGTFVKDVPTIANAKVPIVTEAVAAAEATSTAPVKAEGTTTTAAGATTITSPTHRVSRLPTKRGTTTSPKRNFVRKIPASAPAAARKIAMTATPTPQRSNTHIRLPSAAARSIVPTTTRISTTTPPSRSNSNLNGTEHFTTPSSSAATAKINQAQSRIANIWKRVDEAKSKQLQPAVMRPTTSNLKRIQKQTKSSSALNGTAKTTLTMTPNGNANTTTLIRSSTFDNTPSGKDSTAKPSSRLPVAPVLAAATRH